MADDLEQSTIRWTAEAPMFAELVKYCQLHQEIRLGLKQGRRRKGLTQAELAPLIGLSVKDIRRIEQGSNLDLYSLQRYALAVGATLAVELTLPVVKV